MISQQKQIYWVPYTKSDQGVFERVHEIEMHVGRQPPQDLQPIRDQRSPTHQPPAYFIATTKDVSFAHAPAEHVSCRKYRLIERNQALENIDYPKILVLRFLIFILSLKFNQCFMFLQRVII